MHITKPAKYEARNVRDWLVMADTGAIALPNFQRSYVWQNQRIADYIVALFESRPTGIFLTLQVQGRLRCESRTLKGVKAHPEHAQELVFNGQQRLASLWSALKGEAGHKFFVRMPSCFRALRSLDTGTTSSNGRNWWRVKSPGLDSHDPPRDGPRTACSDRWREIGKPTVLAESKWL